MQNNKLHVSDVLVYPIKSCAAVSAKMTVFEPKGLLFDRIWHIVNENGDSLTQREYPRMSLIQPEFRSHCLAVSMADQINSLLIPWQPVSDIANAVQMSGNQFGLDVGDGAGHWVSNALGVKCRLMRVVPNPNPIVLSDEQKQAEKLFVGHPILAISAVSLADLTTRLEYEVFMNRFRPNIVIGGGTPYQEESWKSMTVNGVVFDGSDKCDRCSLILVDQELGVMTRKEPLRTLATYRKENGKVMFGRYFVPRSMGVIEAGTEIVPTI